MSTAMTYAEALTEAKKVIVQQSHRIKSEIDTIKAQQAQIAETKAALSDREQNMREQAATLLQKSEELAQLDARLKEEVSAREHAEAIVDRQGERVTSMQAQAAEMEKRLQEQAQIIVQLQHEREELAAQVPSEDDNKALEELTHLLTTKRIPASVARECLNQGARPMAQAA